MASALGTEERSDWLLLTAEKLLSKECAWRMLKTKFDILTTMQLCFIADCDSMQILCP